MTFLFCRGGREVPLAPLIVAIVLYLLCLLPILLAVQLAFVCLALVLQRREAAVLEHVTLSDVSIRVETDTSCQDYQWRGIRKICQTRHRLFIYLTSSTACVVPRRAFAAADEWESFNEFCKRKATRLGDISTPRDLFLT